MLYCDIDVLPICLSANFMHFKALASDSFDFYCLNTIFLLLTEGIDLCRRPKLCFCFTSTRISTKVKRLYGQNNKNPDKMDIYILKIVLLEFRI